MKKVFGLQAEINITADDDIVHGIGKGLKSGSVTVAEIVNEVKPSIINVIKNYLSEKAQKKENK